MVTVKAQEDNYEYIASRGRSTETQN